MDIAADNLAVADALGISADELNALVTGGTVVAIEIGVGTDSRYVGGSYDRAAQTAERENEVAAIREWLAALAPETDEQKRLGNIVAQLLDTYDNTSGCKANLIRRMDDAKRKYEEEE